MTVQHINFIKNYYAMQLRRRKMYTLCNVRKKYFSGVLFTRILLRKSYTISREIPVFSIRKSFSHIGSYIYMQLVMRGTPLFMGMPYHIFCSYVRPVKKRRRS